jgi:drug/metabolite transporter (DMT)-like permease
MLRTHRARACERRHGRCAVTAARGRSPSAEAPRPWLLTAGAVFYVFLWASAFVPSRVLATGAPPLWGLSARFLCAGAVLVVIARVARLRWPVGLRAWDVAALYGVLANAMYLGLNYEALRHLSSGMGAIIAGARATSARECR